MYPCLNPVYTMKGSATWSLCMTRHSEFQKKAWMMLTNFYEIPWCRRIFNSDCQCRLSKVFSKSTSTTRKELFHSCACSRIWLRKKMWSMHDFSILKPACSLCCSLPTAVVMRWRMVRQKIMLLMDCVAMPLQLFHSE